MTPEQIVRVLAERDGWTLFPAGKDSFGVQCEAHATHAEYMGRLQSKLPDYLHSTDTLRPVLTKLTLKEMQELEKRINGMFMESGVVYFFGWLVSLSPETWAHAVAEAILACRKMEAL